MNVEIISTGEEVLSGQIVDTNASWLSAELARHGFPVRRRNTVGDRLEDLVHIFRERAREADVIIVNGGLGPTSDDLSSEAAAAAKDEPLTIFSEWVDAMTAKFARSNRQMSPENLKQARLPRSAAIIDNPIGTACGFRIELGGAQLYFTPGVPSEFKRMVTEQILPDMAQRFGMRSVSLLRRLHCFGIAESRLDGLLRPIALPTGVSLGYRAHLPLVEIKVMGLSTDALALNAAVEAVTAQIREILGANVLAEDDDSLATVVQRLMLERGLTLAVAESCTGGLLASNLVEVPGSSGYFRCGYVTYTNQVKHDLLDVPNALFDTVGAVSLEVVVAMARGARRRSGASHALAISGVAGPDGGTESKPVGTVAFALSTPSKTWAQQVRLPDWGRNSIRTVAATLALDMLRRQLLGLEVSPGFDSTRLQGVQRLELNEP